MSDPKQVIVVRNIPKAEVEYPTKDFGTKVKRTRSVKHFLYYNKFQEHHWLHYDTVMDAVLCVECINAFHSRLFIGNEKLDGAFVFNGYSNWKEIQRLAKHHSSAIHQTAVCQNKAAKQHEDVAVMLNQTLAKDQTRRTFLKDKTENVRLLGCQGIAFRVRDSEGNFEQLNKRIAMKVEDFARKLEHGKFLN